MLQAGRSKHTDEYRFGFQGQEADNKIGGLGQHTTAQFWEYDTWAVKRWNTDPVTFPWQSTYATFNNNPILFSDPLGLYGSEKKSERKRKKAEKAGWVTSSSHNYDGEWAFTISDPVDYSNSRYVHDENKFEMSPYAQQHHWTSDVVSHYQSDGFFSRNSTLNSESYLFTKAELEASATMQLNVATWALGIGEARSTWAAYKSAEKTIPWVTATWMSLKFGTSAGGQYIYDGSVDAVDVTADVLPLGVGLSARLSAFADWKVLGKEKGLFRCRGCGLIGLTDKSKKDFYKDYGNGVLWGHFGEGFTTISKIIADDVSIGLERRIIRGLHESIYPTGFSAASEWTEDKLGDKINIDKK